MCVDPVLSVPDSSAPSPPGPSGSGLFARQGGPTRVGPFLFGVGFVCVGMFPPRRISSSSARTLPPLILRSREAASRRIEAELPQQGLRGSRRAQERAPHHED